jgi:parallel beta-helix repeat protein
MTEQPTDEASKQGFDRRRFLTTIAAGGVGAGVAGAVWARSASAQVPTEVPSPTSEAPSGDSTVDNLYVHGPRPWRDVIAFGADPTGTLDSTTAIQQALDDAATEGAVVLVPAGTYSITSWLVVPGGVTLEGTSRTRSVIKAIANSGLIRTGGPEVTIRNLRLQGNDAVVVQNDAVVLLHSDCRVEGIDIVSWSRWAVAAYTTTRVPGDYTDDGGAAEAAISRVTIRDCNLLGPSGEIVPGTPGQFANQGGVYLGPGVSEFVVEGLVLDASPGPSSTGNYSGVRADTSEFGLISGNRIDGKGRTFDGIVAWGAKHITILGNIVRNPHDDGMTYRDNGNGQPAEEILIANNEFYNCGTSGVLCPEHGGYRSISIVNNIIDGTGLSGIRFGGAMLSSCSGNVIRNAAQYGIDVQGGGGGNANPTTESTVSANTIEGCGWSGIHVLPSCERNTITDNLVKNPGVNTGAPNRHGILIEARETTVRDNVVIQAPGDGIKLVSPAAFVHVVGNRVTGSGVAGIYLPPGISDCVVESNLVRSNGTIGIDLFGQGARNQVVGNTVQSNGQTGIRLLHQTDDQVSSNLIMRNGANPAGSSNTHGIRMFNTSRTLVTGNKVGDDQGTPTQSLMIREDGTSDNNTIVGNDLTPGPKSLETSGAASLIRDNKGYVKDNSGVATVTAGTTRVTVNHGLSATPALKDISVTPTTDFGAGSFWVSNPTSTQFTINCNGLKPGAAVSFAWKASIL